MSEIPMHSGGCGGASDGREQQSQSRVATAMRSSSQQDNGPQQQFQSLMNWFEANQNRNGGGDATAASSSQANGLRMASGAVPGADFSVNLLAASSSTMGQKPPPEQRPQQALIQPQFQEQRYLQQSFFQPSGSNPNRNAMGQSQHELSQQREESSMTSLPVGAAPAPLPGNLMVQAPEPAASGIGSLSAPMGQNGSILNNAASLGPNNTSSLLSGLGLSSSAHQLLSFNQNSQQQQQLTLAFQQPLHLQNAAALSSSNQQRPAQTPVLNQQQQGLVTLPTSLSLLTQARSNSGTGQTTMQPGILSSHQSQGSGALGQTSSAAAAAAPSTSTTIPSSDGRTARAKVITERQKFLMFVKILLKFLELQGDPQLQPRAKAIVAECTRRNRMGDANYTPLQDAVERRLRRGVGEIHWAHAKRYFQSYCRRKGVQTVTSI